MSARNHCFPGSAKDPHALYLTHDIGDGKDRGEASQVV